MLHLNAKETYGENASWELHKNAANRFEKIPVSCSATHVPSHKPTKFPAGKRQTHKRCSLIDPYT